MDLLLLQLHCHPPQSCWQNDLTSIPHQLVPQPVQLLQNDLKLTAYGKQVTLQVRHLATPTQHYGYLLTHYSIKRACIRLKIHEHVWNVMGREIMSTPCGTSLQCSSHFSNGSSVARHTKS